MKKAFTLVELVVVLSVIAVLTHLAVRELSHFRNGRLVKAADAQLEDIRNSVYFREARGEVGGFLADMGRMPRLSDGSLAELWSLPKGAKPFAVREASGANLCNGVVSTPGVYVPTGWKGPYIRLRVGKTRLFDPWGNQIETEDSAALQRLWSSNGFVTAVSHYGPKARAEDERRLSILPQGGSSSRLFVTSLSLSSTKTDDMQYRWYAPADGLVTGAVVNATCPGTAVIEGLTPGLRVLWDSVTGAARLVEVKPGDNMISVELP